MTARPHATRPQPSPDHPRIAPPGRRHRWGARCFYLLIALAAVVFAAIALCVRPLPHRPRFWVISGWSGCALFALRLCCGIRWQVRGGEHIPEVPAAVIACKHQSAFETLALQHVLPAHAWVLKQELLRIPFFGWGLAALEPIAIDRSQARLALKQVLEQGLDRLQRGIWVLLFPEGTRMAAGEHGRYAQSAAALAIRHGCPVVPIAHNAGLCWPSGQRDKWSGLITIEIGPPLEPAGRSAAELTAALETWIETTSARLLAEALATPMEQDSSRQVGP